eukprot:TRINITY_DN7411_c0_g1_i1.p1 TRINITY_DN7411_c0_g1~~TRINITY_DN7411_c0_g1_i1.p1  ORF type:complete len:461 (+),score=62.51 TRINITY_DN7411_c0_g1_i1:62-1444(+)
MSEQKQWVPYEEVNPSLRTAMKVRWVVAYPLQKTIGFGWTVGEAIMAAFLIAVVIVAGAQWSTEGSGSLAQLPLIATFATAARHSPITFLLGIPFERRVAYHKMAAVLSYLGAGMHGLIAFVSGEATESGKYSYLWTGLAALGCGLMLYLTSLPPIRRKAFDLFYFAHWPLFLSYVLFLLLHSAAGVVFGVFLWGVDVVGRTVYMAMFQPRKGSIKHITGTDIVEISIEGVKYSAGQYAFIAVPAVGIFQWHPISFSSAPCEGNVARFLIRCAGDWGSALIDLAQQNTDLHTILVDGPYGNSSIDIDSNKYQNFLFVAGGIGITPLRSMATSIADHKKRGRGVQLLEMHWSVRDGVVTAVPMSPEHGLTMYYTGKNIEMGNKVAPIATDNIQNGRMDVNKVVEGFKERVPSAMDSRMVKTALVAVLFCGPGAMLEPLRQACKEHSCPLVQFDIHSETFEF